MKYYVVNKITNYKNLDNETVTLGIYSSFDTVLEKIKTCINNINEDAYPDEIVFDLDNTNQPDYIGYIRINNSSFPYVFDIWHLEVDEG